MMANQPQYHQTYPFGGMPMSAVYPPAMQPAPFYTAPTPFYPPPTMNYPRGQLYYCLQDPQPDRTFQPNPSSFFPKSMPDSTVDTAKNPETTLENVQPQNIPNVADQKYWPQSKGRIFRLNSLFFRFIESVYVKLE